MDYRDWVMLQVLNEYKNITKTAEKLFISQPALSNRLKQIEKEFGTKIVVRGRNGIQFTPEGEYLAKNADKVISLHKNIKENIMNMNQNVTGTLRIASSNVFTRYKLPAVLKRFQEIFPNIEFQITTGLSKDIFQLIYNHEVHIGFVRGDYNWSDEKDLLFQETLCVASKEAFTLKDLPVLPRVDYTTDILLKIAIDNWWRNTFHKPPLIKMEVDQVDIAKDMVISGLGYAVLPSMILNGIDNLYKANITDENGLPIIRETWMYYSAESLELNTVKAFVEFVREFDFEEKNV
ncbi:LysR family transcriptional regulator [Peribacillus asahii]|nr:LysR family transcriptional regulator [Peribacillus asahii]USK71861.1 LysR family transcriptional regulator [Peribacillus asahii]